MKNCFIQKHDRLNGRSGRRVHHLIGWIFIGVIFAVLFALVFGFFVMLLWNWLMPGLFGIREITYWQAFGIVILAKLLFGGFGHRHSNHPRKLRYVHDYWHQRFPHPKSDFSPDKTQKDWEHYEQFWRDEGKAAFQAYVERIAKEKEDDSEK